MEESCLLDFSKLKEGDRVYHILKGWSIVKSFNRFIHANAIMLLVEEGDRYQYYVNCDGRSVSTDNIPAIYRYNPFEKAVREIAQANKKLEESEKENQYLNDKLLSNGIF